MGNRGCNLLKNHIFTELLESRQGQERNVSLVALQASGGEEID